MDNRTNLYVLSLAATPASARTTPARSTPASCTRPGWRIAWAPASLRARGSRTACSSSRRRCSRWTRSTDCLLRVGQARDARHEAIVSMLLQMYSSASSIYVMRAKAEPRAVGHRPAAACACSAPPCQALLRVALGPADALHGPPPRQRERVRRPAGTPQT
jgi:hypothetical protein